MAHKRRSSGGGAHAGPPAPRKVGHPVFSQPAPTADPQVFRIKHASDNAAYKRIDQLNAEHLIQPLPFPPPRGGIEPILTLEQVFGANAEAAAAIATITTNGQIVFHAGGDCGSTAGPATQNEVTDKLVSDFVDETGPELVRFALLLGDIVYSFGEAQYYYDQFYDPYRNYPAPILAVAGNHDGMISPLAHATSLDAFLRNFCAADFEITPDAGGLSRTAQIQPGVFFTFEAPFVRVLALYSNTLEDPGVIRDPTIGDSQIQFLNAALARIKAEAFAGAVIIAHHHPPYTASQGAGRHGWSTQMLADIDAACEAAGVWPHAVLCGHVHNYQRFTRARPDGTQIPYIACGNLGHNVQSLISGGAAVRVPQVLQAAAAGVDQVVFEAYDDINFGYLRVVVTAMQVRVEYHAASDGPTVKAPDDSVTVDLASRTIAHYVAPDLGQPRAAMAIRDAHAPG